jgi:putative holliday junction resolvase
MRQRAVGVDYGMKRIGLALSDDTLLIASPLKTMTAEKTLLETSKKFVALLRDLEKEYRCTIITLVIGMPLHMSGQVGVLADEVGLFIQEIKQECQIEIVTWDERLSTVQAERSLRQGGLSRKKRSRLIDHVSAALVLQSWLDFKRIKEAGSR